MVRCYGVCCLQYCGRPLHFQLSQASIDACLANATIVSTFYSLLLLLILPAADETQNWSAAPRRIKAMVSDATRIGPLQE